MILINPQDDGNVVLYEKGPQALWCTGTDGVREAPQALCEPNLELWARWSKETKFSYK